MKGSMNVSLFSDEPPTVNIHDTPDGPDSWATIRLGGYNAPLITIRRDDALALARALLAAMPEAAR